MTRNVSLTDWGARASDLLGQLASCSAPGPGVTRLPFTPEHRAALDILRAAMEAAGLTVSLDDAGTLIGRREGPVGAKTLLIGSHQDSVPQGGAYDGIMGVVLPILALERLLEEGVQLPFAVEILAFADEEGVRFPTALIGSRALAGTFDPAVLDLQDATGTMLRRAMKSFGLDPERIGDLRRDPDSCAGFLELHIEQGPVLERMQEPVGVVTAICGIERHEITITGETGHAGTLPMMDRRDALVGAAEIISRINQMARETIDLRATVGRLTVEPNAVNAVPGRVRLAAEIRSPRDAIRENSAKTLQMFAQDLATRTGLEITLTRSYSQPAQPCDSAMTAQLAAACKAAGATGVSLPSGATHDASAMADLCPMAMLFVRCLDGVSHRPEEFAAPDDMAAAISVLHAFLSGQHLPT